MHEVSVLVRFTWAVVFSAGVAGTAWSQQSGSNVADKDIAQYKRTAKTACLEGGKKQGDPQAKVDAFCTCIFATLDKSLSHAQWQELVRYSREGKAADEKKALDTHRKELAACRPEPQAQPKTQPEPRREPPTGLKPRPQTGLKAYP